MEKNPYDPPRANVDRPDTAPGSPVKAIFWGSMLSIAGSMGASILISVAWGVVLSTQGHDAEWIANNVENSVPLAGVDLVIGLGLTFWGGWVTAAIARRDELRNAFVLAVILYAVGELLLALVPATRDSLPAWYMPLSYLLTLPAALGGAYFQRRRRKRMGV